MLAAELAAHSEQVASGSVPEPEAKELISSLRIDGEFSRGQHRSLLSQSLPSGGIHAHMGNYPPKPRPKPTMPPSSLMSLPILELPEPSPQSSSLLERTGGLSAAMATDDDDRVGVSLFQAPSRRQQTSFVYAASAPASGLYGPKAHRQGNNAMGGRTPSKTLLEAMANPQS